MRLANIDKRIENNNPIHTLQHKKEILAAYTQSLTILMQQTLSEKKHYFEIIRQRLEAVNPLSIMNKGYSINSIDGEIITDVHKARIGDILETQMQNGKILSKIIEVKENGK